VSSRGRNASPKGQDTSQPGQHHWVAQEGDVEERTETPHIPDASGLLEEHKISTTEHNRSITEDAVARDLAEVMNAWERLPDETRAQVMELVKATAKA